MSLCKAVLIPVFALLLFAPKAITYHFKASTGKVVDQFKTDVSTAMNKAINSGQRVDDALVRELDYIKFVFRGSADGDALAMINKMRKAGLDRIDPNDFPKAYSKLEKLMTKARISARMNSNKLIPDDVDEMIVFQGKSVPL